MGKVRGVSLQGVVRGMWLLVSNFPWTSQFTHFRCLPLEAWNVASDQVEWMQLQMYPPSCQWCWPQHMVSPLTVVLGHNSHRKLPIFTPHNNVRSRPIVLMIDEFSQVC